MDFKSLRDTYTKDDDMPERVHLLQSFRRVLDGSLYDDLQYSFDIEQEGTGDYIPIRERRPSVRSAVCKTVVDQSVALLFGENHFPVITAEDESVSDFIAEIVRSADVELAMIQAATKGAVGSVAVQISLIQGRLFLGILDTEYLTPIFMRDNPSVLEKVIERYKVRGSTLNSHGYNVDDERMYWHRREWTQDEEVVFHPVPVSKKEGEKISKRKDKSRSFVHNLGFCPIVWIKNLEDGIGISPVDGQCTFRDAVDTKIEIDYLLSQGARGLKYSADPALVMTKDPQDLNPAEDSMIRSADNALIVGPEGDAKLLEIRGDGSAAILDYARYLRQMAMEAMHGNKTDADKLAAAQSGRAMEMMNQALIWLASRLRISYGKGLLDIMYMVCQISQKFDIILGGTKYKAKSLPKVQDLDLNWPTWFSDTQEDKQKESQTLTALTSGGLMSHKTAISQLAQKYHVKDIDEEMKQIEQEQVSLIQETGAVVQEKLTGEV